MGVNELINDPTYSPSTSVEDMLKINDLAKEKIQQYSPPQSAPTPTPQQGVSPIAAQAAPPSPQNINQLQQTAQGASADYLKETEKYGTATAKANKEYEENLNNLESQIKGFRTQLKDLPKPPVLQETEQQLAGLAPSIATLMSIVAAGLGKFGKGQGGIGFASAYNAMVDTYHKNNIEDFKAKTEEFRQQLETVKAENEQIILAHKEALDEWLKTGEIEQKKAELALKTAEIPLKLRETVVNIADKNINTAIAIQKSLDDEDAKKEIARHNKAEESLKAQEIKANNEYKNALLKFNETKFAETQEAKKLTSEETAALTQASTEGRLPLSVISSRNPQVQKNVATMLMANPTLDLNRSEAIEKAQTFLERQRSLMESNVITANRHFDNVLNLYDQNPKSGLAVLNQLAVDFNTKITGDQNTVVTGNAIKTALWKYAQVVTGQTTGQAVSDSARGEASTLLRQAWDKDTFHAAVDNERLNMKSTLQGKEDTINFLRTGRGGNVKGNETPKANMPPMPNAKQAADGKWYVPDPNRPGKYLEVQ